MQIALGKGDLDAGFAEAFVDVEQQLALDSRADVDVADPDPQLKIERAFAKLNEYR